MLMGLTRPVENGQFIPVTLGFERAGEVTVELAVQGAGARGPAHRHWALPQGLGRFHGDGTGTDPGA